MSSIRFSRRPRGPQPNSLTLTERQRAVLEHIVRCPTSPQGIATRARIILEGACAARVEYTASDLHISKYTVWLWRQRWSTAAPSLSETESELNDAELSDCIQNVLADQPRSGRPGTFTAEQICQIIKVACEDPHLSHRPISHWTPSELADEVVKREIVECISPRSVGRFLKSGRDQAPSVALLAQP